MWVAVERVPQNRSRIIVSMYWTSPILWALPQGSAHGGSWTCSRPLPAAQTISAVAQHDVLRAQRQSRATQARGRQDLVDAPGGRSSYREPCVDMGPGAPGVLALRSGQDLAEGSSRSPLALLRCAARATSASSTGGAQVVGGSVWRSCQPKDPHGGDGPSGGDKRRRSWAVPSSVLSCKDGARCGRAAPPRFAPPSSLRQVLPCVNVTDGPQARAKTFAASRAGPTSRQRAGPGRAASSL